MRLRATLTESHDAVILAGAAGAVGRHLLGRRVPQCLSASGPAATPPGRRRGPGRAAARPHSGWNGMPSAVGVVGQLDGEGRSLTAGGPGPRRLASLTMMSERRASESAAARRAGN